MPAEPPLIPRLANIQRWMAIGVAGGAMVFIAIVMLLAQMNPGTPANELVGWDDGWLFLLPAAMVAYGTYVGARYWRCPQCAEALPTESVVSTHCPRCGFTLRKGQSSSREPISGLG